MPSGATSPCPPLARPRRRGDTGSARTRRRRGPPRSACRQCTGDDRRGEVVRVVMDGRLSAAVDRVQTCSRCSRRSPRRSAISPVSCVLQGRSSACRSSVQTRALLNVPPMGPPRTVTGQRAQPVKSHHCHLPESSAVHGPYGHARNCRTGSGRSVSPRATLSNETCGGREGCRSLRLVGSRPVEGGGP